MTSSATVCYKCQGEGAFKSTVTKTKDCSSCNGSGSKHNTQTCSTCNGNKVFADSYNSYTVTLKDCGSTLATSSVSVNMPYKLTVPTRNGYTFIGWFDSAENGTQYTDGAGICLSVWSESANKTLYAHWSLNYYTITYDCDEDVDLSGMPTVYTVEDEDFALNSQNKTHYSFSWKLDNITVTSIDTAIAQDIVVKGVWISLANSPVIENRVEATCTEDGHYDSVVYCNRCNDELSRQTITIPASHTPKSAVEENRVEATCTEDGHYDSVVYCNRCDEELSRQPVTIPVAAHIFTKDLRCSKCGAQTTYYRDGNYIYFGEYPQTIKADSVTITETLDSRGYYLGSDGFYYAKVVADTYRSGYKFSTGATVTDGATYYFKVEPIRWRILSTNGETALILCDSIIANKAYDAGSEYNNNYKNSDIRAWLNASFYETAFTELQREIILTTKVDNRVASTGYSFNSNACENTHDKIFLLSYREVTNSAYGFASYSTYDTARRMQTSDYSRATGANMSTSPDYYGNGDWLLRSPDDNSSSIYVRGVYYLGYTSYEHVANAGKGVVPALQIRL